MERRPSVPCRHHRGEHAATNIRSPSLPAGLIVDEEGERLAATHASKNKVRYRYYVSRALQHDPGACSRNAIRIPAREIEAAVIERVAEALDDPLALLGSIGIAPAADELQATMREAEKMAIAVRKKDFTLIRKLVAQVRALPREVAIELSTSALTSAFRVQLPNNANATIAFTSPVRLIRTGRSVRLVSSTGKSATAGTPDQALIRLLLKAREWWARLADGRTDIATIARDEGINDSYVSRVVRLNFLAPQLLEEILAGTQPAMLSAARMKAADLPAEWNRQLRLAADI